MSPRDWTPPTRALFGPALVTRFSPHPFAGLCSQLFCLLEPPCSRLTAWTWLSARGSRVLSDEFMGFVRGGTRLVLIPNRQVAVPSFVFGLAFAFAELHR
jgi:hypothetical protein